jgi:tRNA threonylcarbamoyladenosine biosynthesis protein TsaE
VEGHIPSPTFNLVFRYDARGERMVAHLDLYRLAGPEEVHELGWNELPGPEELVLVEWPERAEALLPADRWDIRLVTPAGAPELRQVTADPRGNPPPLPAPEGGG